MIHIPILAALGGGTVVATGIITWSAKILRDKVKLKLDEDLEKAKSELSKDLEQHKTKLKITELLFQKKYEATSAYILYLHDITDYIQDLDDPYPSIMNNLREICGKTENYLRQYGVILSNDIYKKLKEISDDIRLMNSNDEAEYLAKKLYNLIYEIKQKLLNELKENYDT